MHLAPTDQSERVRQDEVEALLNRAIELLLLPTLENMRAVEEVLREAVVRMPDCATNGLGKKVRICERLLANAERSRPGIEGPPADAYTPQGDLAVRAQFRHRLELEA